MPDGFQFTRFSKKQRMLFNWWSEKSPVSKSYGIIADGAIRSGKTLCMSLSFVMWAMDNFSGMNFGMCGKTIGSFRRNVLNVLKVTLPNRGYQLEDHRGDKLLIVRRGNRQNNFYIFGGKDESSQDLVQGITLAGVFFDEVALMPESFVNQATARCSVEGSKLWFNCNPEGPYHWFYTDWISRKEQRKLLYLHFTMDDNLSLAEEIKDRYRSQYTGVFYKRYILGEWSIAEGIIYDMFDPARHVKPITELAPILTESSRYVSVDYGTQNATVFLLWCRGKDGRWYCVREYYYSGRDIGRQKTDSEYVQDMGRWLDGTSVKALIVDPSAASFIAALRRAGYKVLPAKNNVLDGIRMVSSRLTQGSIGIADTCKNTIAEFQSYVWDEKAAEQGEDKPVKVFDHAMDAVRYFVFTILGDNVARLRGV